MEIHLKEWLSPTELEIVFGFKTSSQSKLRMDRVIPFHKVGKTVRYKKNEIVEWLEHHKVERVS